MTKSRNRKKPIASTLLLAGSLCWVSCESQSKLDGISTAARSEKETSLGESTLRINVINMTATGSKEAHFTYRVELAVQENLIEVTAATEVTGAYLEEFSRPCSSDHPAQSVFRLTGAGQVTIPVDTSSPERAKACIFVRYIGNTAAGESGEFLTREPETALPPPSKKQESGKIEIAIVSENHESVSDGIIIRQSSSVAFSALASIPNFSPELGQIVLTKRTIGSTCQDPVLEVAWLTSSQGFSLKGTDTEPGVYSLCVKYDSDSESLRTWFPQKIHIVADRKAPDNVLLQQASLSQGDTTAFVLDISGVTDPHQIEFFMHTMSETCDNGQLIATGSYDGSVSQVAITTPPICTSPGSYKLCYRIASDPYTSISFPLPDTTVVAERFCACGRESRSLGENILEGEPGVLGICSLNQLLQLKDYPDTDMKLLQDIDASPTAAMNAGAGLAPLFDGFNGSYSGIFDGQNHTISGLTINRPGESGQSLFGAIGNATIRNVRVTGVNIAGSTNTAVLVSHILSPSRFENISLQGTLSGLSYCGGAAAQSTLAAPMSVDFADIEINLAMTCTSRGGGVIGDLASGTITNISGAMSVTGNDYLGGIAGRITNTTVSSVRDFSAALTAVSRTGGAVGQATTSTVTNVDLTVTGSGNSTLATVFSNFGGVIGQADSSTILSDIHARGQLNLQFGSSVGGIVGLCQGGGNISDSSSRVNVYGSGSVGGLAGAINTCKISRCVSQGFVSGGHTSAFVKGVGGLVGLVSGSSTNPGLIEDSYAIGNVINFHTTGPNLTSTGGLAGAVYTYGKVDRSYSAYSEIKHPSPVAIGGLVGSVESTTNALVLDSFSTSKVTASVWQGGLIGIVFYNDPDVFITNSWWDITQSGQSRQCNSFGGGNTRCSNAFGISGNPGYWFSQSNPPLNSWSFGTGNPWVAHADTVPSHSTQSAHKIFVSSTTHTGDLGGISGADNICANLATTASLPGTWRAFLSAVSNPAILRYRLNGTVRGTANNFIAQGIEKMIRAKHSSDSFAFVNLKSAVIRDENGVDVTGTGTVAWTGSSETGHLDPAAPALNTDCNGWASSQAADNGTMGDGVFLDTRWISSGNSSCDQLRRIYCISID